MQYMYKIGVERSESVRMHRCGSGSETLSKMPAGDSAEPEFGNVEGAQEAIPRNRFRPPCRVAVSAPKLQMIAESIFWNRFMGSLKVHKIENFFGSEFEFYTISLLVMLKN